MDSGADDRRRPRPARNLLTSRVHVLAALWTVQFACRSVSLQISTASNNLSQRDAVVRADPESQRSRLLQRQSSVGILLPDRPRFVRRISDAGTTK